MSEEYSRSKALISFIIAIGFLGTVYVLANALDINIQGQTDPRVISAAGECIVNDNLTGNTYVKASCLINPVEKENTCIALYDQNNNTALGRAIGCFGSSAGVNKTTGINATTVPSNNVAHDIQVCTKQSGNGTGSGYVLNRCLNTQVYFSEICNSWPFMDARPLGCVGSGSGSTTFSNSSIAGLTPAQVVVACAKYDTGSGYIFSECLNDKASFSVVCANWPFTDERPLGCAIFKSPNAGLGLSPSIGGNASSAAGTTLALGSAETGTGGGRSNPTVTNDRYYEGLNWWAVCNNPVLRSYITQSCNVLVTPDQNALTYKGKVVLEGILCPKGPSIISTLELFYGSIPQRLKNDLTIACGWH